MNAIIGRGLRVKPLAASLPDTLCWLIAAASTVAVLWAFGALG